MFKRQGANHLKMVKSISLAESLCGFEFTITHLDDRVLLVKSEPGVVYKPGDTKKIVHEGMPSERNAFDKGNLYIEFQVEFPKPGDLSDNTLKVCVVLL